MMNVFLTFDIEIWCNGWDNLDQAFPRSFERYVYGHSVHGDFALPQTLAILNKNGLKGVFFVEPLFATRFGLQYLEVVIGLIRDAGHEIQLHLHPEWTDEAITPLIANCKTKRQHLTYYSLEEQTALIAHGLRLLQAAGSGPVCAFRSGSFAANRDTFDALRRNGILLDTSLNRCHAVSGPDLQSAELSDGPFDSPSIVHGVSSYPVTIIRDGFGRDRPAQVGACSFDEMRDALLSAKNSGRSDFVLVSHNFEMLKPGLSKPDWIVVQRFTRLCEFLAANGEAFTVRGFSPDLHLPTVTAKAQPTKGTAQPQASWLSTSLRYFEQVVRRLK